MKECPQCKSPVQDLISVDSGFRMRLQYNGIAGIPDELCSNCYQSIQAILTKGAKAYAKQKAKEENRLQLWKNRVILVKKARLCMKEKSFAEAAVTYEKYLKSMEVVFDVKGGDLTPTLFKEAARTKEITVVAAVYWDLLRIYDSSSKYSEQQFHVANQLASFIRYTPVYPDIMRRAQQLIKTANNPAAIKAFIKAANANRPRCFIATSAFSSSLAPEVLILTKFRDEVLKRHYWGRIAIFCYYCVSPPVARFLDLHPRHKPMMRNILRRVISTLDL